MKNIKIKRAIVSVFDKSNLDILIEYFEKYSIEVLSTGGTYDYIKKKSKRINIKEISEFTKFKEILEGRVKSLHPYIHAGILADKNKKKHVKQLNDEKIPFVDLVVINLYPFENISKRTSSTDSDCIENIDIGGPTLIRGAAKNFNSVTILTSPNQYKSFLNEIVKNKNSVSVKFRKECACMAFELTANYDAIISNWFNRNELNFCKNKISIPVEKVSELKYGENPHQKAAYFKFGNGRFSKISGKELSFNNIYDAEIAIELAQQFSKPSCVIVKHGNPCGVAIDKIQDKAYTKALKCDRVSAFGGIVAFNNELSIKSAKEINKIFTEIIIAPKFSSKVKKILSAKKNLILIEYHSSKSKTSWHLKTTRNFLLLQEKDNKLITKKDLKVKTKKKPTQKLLDDMIFAFKVSKFINSNAIVLVSNLCTVGIGVGQTNRVDSAQQALKRMNTNFKNIKAVMASDGFFPFPDIVDLCSNNNVIGIIQPGGSKNDSSVIKAAEKSKIQLIFTGIRHFKH